MKNALILSAAAAVGGTTGWQLGRVVTPFIPRKIRVPVGVGLVLYGGIKIGQALASTPVQQP